MISSIFHVTFTTPLTACSKDQISYNLLTISPVSYKIWKCEHSVFSSKLSIGLLEILDFHNFCLKYVKPCGHCWIFEILIKFCQLLSMGYLQSVKYQEKTGVTRCKHDNKCILLGDLEPIIIQKAMRNFEQWVPSYNHEHNSSVADIWHMTIQTYWKRLFLSFAVSALFINNSKCLL